MKKIFLPLLLSVILFSNLKAQETEKKSNHSIGLHVGINFSNLYSFNGFDSDYFMDDDFVDLDFFRVGLNLGITYEYKFENNFAIQPGVFYSQQGDRDDNKWFTSTKKVEIDYLNIPINIKYYIFDHLSVGIVPTFGILLSSKASILDISSDITNPVFKNYDSNYFNSFDFGMGFDIAGHYNNFNLGVRFTANFIRINKNGMFTSTDVLGRTQNASLRNNFTSIYLGYNLPL